MTRKPCDDAFDREEKSFRKAAERLLGAAIVCIRQAGSDLARACRTVRDPDVEQLGVLVTENLRGERNFDNVLAACRLFTSGRRRDLNATHPSPSDLIVIAAMNLEDACENLLSPGTTDLPSVGPCTVRSRSASEKVLSYRG